MYNIFVDFKWAFYSVNRTTIYESLKDYEVPLKVIQSIKITLTNTVTEAKINNDFSEYLEDNTVVRQVISNFI
jgi:hypothetical protein